MQGLSNGDPRGKAQGYGGKTTGLNSRFKAENVGFATRRGTPPFIETRNSGRRRSNRGESF
jgi:hypothetical protein